MCSHIDVDTKCQRLIVLGTIVRTMSETSHVDDANADVNDNGVRPTSATFRQPSVRSLAIGEFAVMLLSQMWFVTLSWWLVSSRGGGAAIGGVLAVGAIPRAACMLIGGAVSDRLSPASVLRGTAAARVIVMVASFIIASGGSPIWQLFVVSAAFGVVDGFAFPAVTATLPMIASGAELARLNAMVQLSDQVTQVVGPASAAFILARYGTRSAVSVTTVLAVVALMAFGQLARLIHRPARATGASIGHEIIEGFRYSWHRADLRAYLLVVGGLGLGTVGPMTLGSALLAKDRFGGASSLGWLLAGFGVGAFAGAVFAGLRPPTFSPKRLLVILCAVVCVGMLGLALAPTLPIAVVVAVLTAMSWGYEGVVTATWLQSTTDAAFQGRVASLLAFSFLALDPVSQAITGALSSLGAGVSFAAGAALVGVVGVVVSRLRWPEVNQLPTTTPATSTLPM
jgi:MFS family permease